ncbi:MAG: hypothetical protein K6A70_01860 [Erysipelotrichaceae bacterium]|nr:hypothetical protein [Erysipelotrichaceae bacterium]
MKHISLISILSLSIFLTLCGCANDQKDKQSIAVGWHDRQDSYTFVSTLKTIEETGAVPRVLEMVRPDYLDYDENGKLIDAKDGNGMLT